MGKSVMHKNKYRQGWFSKLCEPTLYADVNVTRYWSEVTCGKCIRARSAMHKCVSRDSPEVKCGMKVPEWAANTWKPVTCLRCLHHFKLKPKRAKGE